MALSLSFVELLVAVLAVWRVTHLFWGEDGPFDLFVRLRRLAGESVGGRLLDCFYCLSLWVAVPMALWLETGWLERAVVWLGIAGGAVLLQRVTTPRPPAPPPAVWRREPLDEEIDDVVLR
jgi:hypothetical protein